jgi:hypothetical protein
MITKRITLTDKGINAGPVFSVYVSPDCNTFTLNSDITLGSVGAYADILIPTSTQCIKLISNGTCTTSVIHTVPGALQGDFSFDFSQLDFS